MVFCVMLVLSSNIIYARTIETSDYIASETESSDWTVMIYLAADISSRNNFIECLTDIFSEVGDNSGEEKSGLFHRFEGAGVSQLILNGSFSGNRGGNR